jgi:hypothetical protein
MMRASIRKERTMRLPVILCGASNDTKEAYALFRTGPHQPWHLVDLYDFESDAMEAMQQGKSDMHTDGMIVRHVTFGAVTRWNRPRPGAKKTAGKTRKRTR